MIVTTDIGNILYRDCKAFGIDLVPDGETLTGELKIRKDCHPHEETTAGKVLEEIFRRSESMCTQFKRE